MTLGCLLGDLGLCLSSPLFPWPPNSLPCAGAGSGGRQKCLPEANEPEDAEDAEDGAHSRAHPPPARLRARPLAAPRWFSLRVLLRILRLGQGKDAGSLILRPTPRQAEPPAGVRLPGRACCLPPPRPSRRPPSPFPSLSSPCCSQEQGHYPSLGLKCGRGCPHPQPVHFLFNSEL